MFHGIFERKSTYFYDPKGERGFWPSVRPLVAPPVPVVNSGRWKTFSRSAGVRSEPCVPEQGGCSSFCFCECSDALVPNKNNNNNHEINRRNNFGRTDGRGSVVKGGNGRYAAPPKRFSVFLAAPVDGRSVADAATAWLACVFSGHLHSQG